MGSNSSSSVIDNKKIKLLVLQYIKNVIMNTKGQIVTFRPAKLAQEISARTHRSPRAESVIIRNFFEELVECKLVHVVKRGARGKVYGIYKDTPLWSLLKNHDVSQVYEFIEGLIESKVSEISYR